MCTRLMASATLGVALAGCATYSEKIAPSYVSPVIYEHLSCRQIAEEAARVSARAGQVAGIQDSQANRDNWLTAATIVVFWPAAFFVKRLIGPDMPTTQPAPGPPVLAAKTRKLAKLVRFAT